MICSNALIELCTYNDVFKCTHWTNAYRMRFSNALIVPIMCSNALIELCTHNDVFKCTHSTNGVIQYIHCPNEVVHYTHSSKISVMGSLGGKDHVPLRKKVVKWRLYLAPLLFCQ